MNQRNVLKRLLSGGLWDSSVVEHLPSICEALGSILALKKNFFPELKTLQCWKWHTRGRKSWQGNFFWSKGCKHVLTPAEWTHKHKMADSGSSLYPWPSYTCCSPGICPGQRFTISLNWLKGLGDGLEHTVRWAMELYRNLEEANTL
jgi:hypothetical protein